MGHRRIARSEPIRQHAQLHSGRRQRLRDKCWQVLQEKHMSRPKVHAQTNQTKREPYSDLIGEATTRTELEVPVYLWLSEIAQYSVGKQCK